MTTRIARVAVAVWVALTVGHGVAEAQRGQAPPTPPRRTPRQLAPTDFTGNWVAVITEDWRFRMVTPPKGDVASIPLSEAGQMRAAAWDPAKDAAAGEQCRAYGAAGLMRLPIRLRISWQDDATLKLETDNGQQVRLFKFGNPPTPTTAPDWQGHSVAAWETLLDGQGQAAGGGGGGGGGRAGQEGPQLSGSLKVVTSRLRPGYLRRNGVPYSGQTVLTEYFDRTNEANGDSWLILTSTVDDPANLAQPFMTSTHFKREADGTKWAPRPCEITPEVRGRVGRGGAGN